MRPPACQRHSSRDHMATIGAKSRVCPHEERPPSTANERFRRRSTERCWAECLGRQKSEMPATAELYACATGSARAVSGERCEILMDAAQHEILLMASSDATGRVRLADRSDPRRVPLDWLA